MHRVILALALCLPAAASPAQDLRALCESSGATAAEAAELRRAGDLTEAEAAARIAAAQQDAPAVQALVPQISAWVWGLPAEALDPEVIRRAFVAQCLEQGEAMQ